ncbi:MULTISPECIES: hypothetical protein [unclassified Prevotella]|uniref:hypothetical protein n=1 Tax=unclassified Prevotella TaxID=2638335 RepID=UPI0018CC38A1|nr:MULTISPECIES: hypothetical protein [unclassified Prevotella]
MKILESSLPSHSKPFSKSMNACRQEGYLILAHIFMIVYIAAKIKIISESSKLLRKNIINQKVGVEEQGVGSCDHFHLYNFCITPNEIPVPLFMLNCLVIFMVYFNSPDQRDILPPCLLGL